MGRLIAAVLLCALAGSSYADTATRKARSAFIDGTSLYNLGKFDEAIAQWEEGYRNKPDPIFLYNIAQAHRLNNNAERAIFFYKSYLRNSPTATNRDEVLQKIQKLESVLAAQRETRELPPDVALTPGVMKPESSRPAPKPEPRPLHDPIGPAPSAVPPPAALVAPAAEPVLVAPAAPPSRPLRGDIGVSGGVHLWGAGAPADPAFSFQVTGGYQFFSRGRISLRAGAKLAYTMLSDAGATVSLISVLADPALRVRLWRERLFAFVEIGLGALIVSGLPAGSGLLVPHSVPNGALAAFELRPALGLDIRVVRRFGITAAVGLAYSPAPDSAFIEPSLLRVDVSLGASLRL